MISSWSRGKHYTNPTRNSIMQVQAITGWPRQLVVWVPKGQEDSFAASTASEPLLLLRNTDNKLSVPPKTSCKHLHNADERCGSGQFKL
jgi:hypothetical protein